MNRREQTPGESADADRAPQEKPSKRRYTRPRLVEYGSVAKLTAAKTGRPVDGGMPMAGCL